MIADIRAGKLWDDTMAGHFEYLRHLKGRWECIVGEIRKESSRHRGPGTPGYVDLDRGKGIGKPGGRGTGERGTGGPHPTRPEAGPPSPPGEGFWRGGERDVVD